MGWGISFRLRPEEEIIDTSMESEKGIIKPVYSVILTNQRVLFNFIPMSSTIIGSSFLCQSFNYDEISRVEVAVRLFVKYLRVITPRRDYYLNVANPDYWVEKIMDFKNTLQEGFSNPETS
jgi:hypothetical protein